LNKQFWTFQNKGNKVGELLLYGEISDVSWRGDEVTPLQFKKDLDALGSIDTLNIYVNSPGGDVFASQAMVSMLERHTSKKNVYNDGLMASAATFFIGVGKVYMPENAIFMVHCPASIVWGNAKDMRKMADDLDKVQESMLAIYRKKTGMTNNQIIPLLDAETWMSAEEAVKYGFCDEVLKTKQIAASISGRILTINGLDVELNRFKSDPSPKLKDSSQSTVVDVYKLKLKNNERRTRLAGYTQDLQKKLYDDLKKRADLS